MSSPGRSPAYAGAIAVLLLTVVIFMIGSPAAAALVLTNESFSPVPPLVAGSGLHAGSTIMIIPAGATTFPRAHTLQMQTDCAGPWIIQVMVHGIPAAQQSTPGTSAFVHGISFRTRPRAMLPSGSPPRDGALTIPGNRQCPYGRGD